jgi:hypothetical protein
MGIALVQITFELQESATFASPLNWSALDRFALDGSHAVKAAVFQPLILLGGIGSEGSPIE